MSLLTRALPVFHIPVLAWNCPTTTYHVGPDKEIELKLIWTNTQLPAVCRWTRCAGLRQLSLLLLVLAAAGLHSTAQAQAVFPGDEANGPYPGYWTWPGIVQQLEEYEREYPHLIQVQSIGKSHEGRDILVAKISADVEVDDPDKPELLYMAGIHAREQSPQISVMRFMEELLTGYGKDERVSRLLDTRAIWILPVLNVDGKVYDMNSGRANGTTRGANWRTNRHDFGPGEEGRSRVGVDLNRNGLVGWGSASDTPGTQTYHGPGPLSEAETRALFDFMGERRFRVFLDVHSTLRTFIIPPRLIREEAERYYQLTRGMATRQREPYSVRMRRETETGPSRGTGVGQTHVTGFYVHGAYSIVYEMGPPRSFYCEPDDCVAFYEENVRENWFYLAEEAVHLPLKREGDFRIARASLSGPLVPGSQVTWVPRVTGDVAYGVLVSQDPAIRVTGDYRLFPLRGGGFTLNVAEDVEPGMEIPLQLILWDRERRQSIIDVPVVVEEEREAEAVAAVNR